MHCVDKPDLTFQSIQRGFADYIRAPADRPLPQGVAAERMAIYRELFFNNVADFLADSFPVLRMTVTDAHWQALVGDFYARHACVTPLFTRLAEEFLDYLQRERGQIEGDPPFLVELAHYEWVELEITLRDADPLPLETTAPDLSQSRIRLSPLVWLLSYRYPVHQIGPGYHAASAEQRPVYLLVYRDRLEQVVFLEIDLLSHSLLSVLRTVGEAQVGELLESLTERVDSETRGELLSRGMDMFRMLYQRGVIGSATPSIAESNEHKQTVTEL